MLITLMVGCAQKKKLGGPFVEKKKIDGRPSYSREANCSKRGLAYLAKTNNIHITFEDEDAKIKKFMLKKKTDVYSCYQDHIDLSKNNKEYVLCIIAGLNPKGVLEFLDIADDAHGLPKNLQACLVKKFSSYKYKTFRTKHGLTIMQPFNLYLKP